MSSLSINGSSNTTNIIIESESSTITDGVNITSELPVFANKSYVGKFQTGRLQQPVYVVYTFNKDGTKYNLNFDFSYSTLFSSFAQENVIITKQNTPPGFIGSYYKGFDASGSVFTGYQQTGIKFVDNKLYWFPEVGPLLRTTKEAFDTNFSIFYEASMASFISQQLELYPTKYYADPLAWLTDPYMIDSTNITESDLSLQTNSYNISYNQQLA